jgi:hypothetical protein
LDFCFENLSKVSSREILGLTDFPKSCFIVFLSFLRYSSFNSSFSIFEIKAISKFSCSSSLEVTLQNLQNLLSQQDLLQPILKTFLLDDSLAK